MKNYRCFFLEISSIAMALSGLNMRKTIYKCRIKMFLSCLKKGKRTFLRVDFIGKRTFLQVYFIGKRSFFGIFFIGKRTFF